MGVVSYEEKPDRYFSTDKAFNKLAVNIRERLVGSSVPASAIDKPAVLCTLGVTIPVVGSVLAVALSSRAARPHVSSDH